jgi:hypothetical protein
VGETRGKASIARRLTFYAYIAVAIPKRDIGRETR